MKFLSIFVIAMIVLVSSSLKPCSAQESDSKVQLSEQKQEQALASAGKGAGVVGGVADGIGIITGGKQCWQCAIWIATPNQACVKEAADWLQNNYFKGDDGYLIESSGNNGGWVRYWRVGLLDKNTGKCHPKVANGKTGKCRAGGTWRTDNAQATSGKVHCKHQ